MAAPVLFGRQARDDAPGCLDEKAKHLRVRYTEHSKFQEAARIGLHEFDELLLVTPERVRRIGHQPVDACPLGWSLSIGRVFDAENLECKPSHVWLQVVRLYAVAVRQPGQDVVTLLPLSAKMP